MQLNVKEKSEKRILIELPGETYTLTNLLREYLWDEPNVSEAAAIKEHPFLEEPKILVATSRGSPLTALKKTSEKLQQSFEELEEKFKAALKERK